MSAQVIAKRDESPLFPRRKQSPYRPVILPPAHSSVSSSATFIYPSKQVSRPVDNTQLDTLVVLSKPVLRSSFAPEPDHRCHSQTNQANSSLYGSSMRRSYPCSWPVGFCEKSEYLTLVVDAAPYPYLDSLPYYILQEVRWGPGERGRLLIRRR